MNPASVYQDYAVETQSRGKIVVLLYDGAIKFLKLAKSELDKGNFFEKGQYIGRAQDIISELNSVLDMEVGGEVAQNLRSLYNFMSTHLIDANIKSDPDKIDDVITLLEELNKGWKAIAR